MQGSSATCGPSFHDAQKHSQRLPLRSRRGTEFCMPESCAHGLASMATLTFFFSSLETVPAKQTRPGRVCHTRSALCRSMGSRSGMCERVSSFHSCISSSRCARTSHGLPHLCPRSSCTCVCHPCNHGLLSGRTPSTLFPLASDTIQSLQLPVAVRSAPWAKWIGVTAAQAPGCRDVALDAYQKV